MEIYYISFIVIDRRGGCGVLYFITRLLVP